MRAAFDDGPRTYLSGSKTGVVAAEGVELAVGADYMSAAAVDAVLIPGPGVHEGLDHEPEGLAARGLQGFEQFAERLVFTAAFREVLQRIVNLVLQEALKLGEVQEVAHMP